MLNKYFFKEGGKRKTHIYNMLFGNAKKSFRLLYKGSVHGFSAEEFHKKCDNMGPTISIIKSDKNKVFGGYASVSWNSLHLTSHVNDPHAFVFSISKKSKHYQYDTEC